MLSNQMRTIGVDEQALSTLKYLASQVATRPLMYGLVQSDVNRWDEYDLEERHRALKRAVRRVGSVCPWVRSKPRVMDTLRDLASA
ncbi:MAG: hypothetical protein ACAH95_16680 [Fimbriimonas sp.]